jgi:hypothetical protein
MSLPLPKKHHVPAIWGLQQLRAADRGYADWLKTRPIFMYEMRRPARRRGDERG